MDNILGNVNLKDAINFADTMTAPKAEEMVPNVENDDIDVSPEELHEEAEDTVQTATVVPTNVKPVSEKKNIATSLHPEVRTNGKAENTVILSGYIAKKTELKSIVRLVIGVREIIHNRNGVQEEVNYPNVIVMKEKDNSSIADDFMVHDFVKLTCHVSSYSRQIPSSLERTVIQSFVADKIEPGTTFYPDAVGENLGRRVEMTQNIVHLCGRVIEIMNRENKSSYLRMEARNGHVRNVVGVYVNASHAENIKVGATLDLYGKVKTYIQETKNAERPVIKREIIQELRCSIVSNQVDKASLDTLPTPPKTAETVL